MQCTSIITCLLLGNTMKHNYSSNLTGSTRSRYTTTARTTVQVKANRWEQRLYSEGHPICTVHVEWMKRGLHAIEVTFTSSSHGSCGHPLSPSWASGSSPYSLQQLEVKGLMVHGHCRLTSTWTGMDGELLLKGHSGLEHSPWSTQPSLAWLGAGVSAPMR